MKIFAESDRLMYRELLLEDAPAMFEMDSDPEVHRYLGNKPVKTLEETQKMIEHVRQQYVDFGMGRWAMIEKSTNNFLGWAGLKYIVEPLNNHTDFYDLGYRLLRKHWGQGFASEAAIATRDYAFEELKVPLLYGATDINNHASTRVLQKTGFQLDGFFMYEDIPCNWLVLKKERYEGLIKTLI